MRSIARNVALEMALQQRSIGRRIAQLRERAHLTQEAAADRAGVTLRAYQKWEAGGGIQYSNLQKLAETLRTTVEEITGDAETPSPFKVGEQIDDMAAEFRGYVGQILDLLQEARSERKAIRALLKTQESILQDMRRVADEFPAKAEMEAFRAELARQEERDRAAEAKQRERDTAAGRARRRRASGQ